MFADRQTYDFLRGPGDDWPRYSETGKHAGEWIHQNRRIATFRCSACRQYVPWSQGGGDDDLCNKCWCKQNRETTNG